VGDQGPQFHAEVGVRAHRHGIDALFALGDLSAAAATAFGTGRHFADMEALQQAVQAQLAGVASVLVKGSRFMKMERVVAAITAGADSQ
jgi:UDP-N-acetylmuramoyl-tripeptide--D-alanyl-D-alanine ligase